VFDPGDDGSALIWDTKLATKIPGDEIAFIKRWIG